MWCLPPRIKKILNLRLKATNNVHAFKFHEIENVCLKTVIVSIFFKLFFFRTKAFKLPFSAKGLNNL